MRGLFFYRCLPWAEELLTNSTSLKVGVFLLPLVIVFFLAWLLMRLAKKSANLNFFRSRWFYILLFFSIPLVFINARPFDGQVLGFDGLSYQPLMPIFASLPVIFAVGLAGPLAGVLLAAFVGLAMMLFLKQDLSLILYYPLLVLVFANQLNESYQDASSTKTLILKLFETGMLGLPFWMLYQYNLALVYGLRDLIAVLTQAIFLWALHLPELIMTSLALILLLRFLPQEWKPRYFLNEPKHASALDEILEKIALLRKGDYSQEIRTDSTSRSEQAISEALEELRKSLQTRDDAQSRLLSLDPSNYSHEDYDLVMKTILDAALTKDASAARLILVDINPQTGEKEMRLRLGRGEHARTYAYLDLMVLEKLADQDQLVLNDLKLDQYFGLTPGTPYPKSLIALHLRDSETAQGVLWVGFEQNRWFSDDDIKFYQGLAYRATAALNTKQKIIKVHTEKTWLNEVLNAIDDPILVLNANREVIHSNIAGQNLINQAQDLVGNHAGRKTIPQSKMLELMQTQQASFDKEKTINLSDKEYRVDILPVKLEGKETGSVIYLKDNHWVDQANQEKVEFIRNVSHDLRSPLRLMIGYAKLIKNIGKLSEQQLRFVNQIESGLEVMKHQVGNVLDMDRLDADAGLMYITFDFKEMVYETVAMFESQAQQKKISINTDFGALKLPYISADRVLLQQAIYNLIENAIKFSPRGETVLIRAEKDASWMHFSVTDHGKGIAPLDQTRIFNRFFHMDDDQNFENRGQGLGLSIAKSIVEKHGGTISVDSKLGSGSTFYIDVPLHRIEGMRNLTKASE